MSETLTGGQTGTVVRDGVVRRMLRNPMGVVALVILGAVILAALFAAVLAPKDPNYADILNILAPPARTTCSAPTAPGATSPAGCCSAPGSPCSPQRWPRPWPF